MKYTYQNERCSIEEEFVLSKEKTCNTTQCCIQKYGSIWLSNQSQRFKHKIMNTYVQYVDINKIVRHFGKYTCPLSSRELDEKNYSNFLSVR